MRTTRWAVACVVGGLLVAATLYAVFWVGAYRRLPHLQRMELECRPAGQANAVTPTALATARCKAYFADLHVFGRTAKIQTAITAVLAAYVLLVLRFRVRPLSAAGRPKPRE